MESHTAPKNNVSAAKRLLASLDNQIASLDDQIAKLRSRELDPESVQIEQLRTTISGLTARVALQDERIARLGGLVARLTENPDGIGVVNAKKHKIGMGTNRDIVADGCAIDSAVSSAYGQALYLRAMLLEVRPFGSIDRDKMRGEKSGSGWRWYRNPKSPLSALASYRVTPSSLCRVNLLVVHVVTERSPYPSSTAHDRPIHASPHERTKRSTATLTKVPRAVSGPGQDSGQTSDSHCYTTVSRPAFPPTHRGEFDFTDLRERSSSSH